ncbi:MAG: tetratricopeptide (TPR) repeat protein [Pirellulaceae bacterium]|jgi:tetratricopeptide (TPR) repeat protein
MAKKTHRWTFKSHFRAKAYSWKSSSLASKRLREAVSEIKKVKRTDPILAVEGCVDLIERLWPALEAIDTSSGMLGNAVYRTLNEIIPIIVAAPADLPTRQKWCDRLYQAILDDGVDYLSPVADRWGNICHFDELVNTWVDRMLPLLREVWANESHGWVDGCTLCFSCLVRAERYDELEQLLSLKSHRFWCFDQYWANALIQQGDLDGAIAFAESQLEGRHNNDAARIEEFCERVLLSAGRSEEAYQKYGLSVSRAGTNLATYRNVIKKYPERDPRRVLLDLIEHSGSKGKWFAAAKSVGFLDLAIECAADMTAEPATLIRAARDFVIDNPDFAMQVAFHSLGHLLAGRGYETSTADVMQAYGHLMTAAASANNIGRAQEMLESLLEKRKSQPSPMWHALQSLHQRGSRE